MNSFKKNKGITLIALVITIIVMLILVAVTINIAVNGGLFDYAGKAARKTEEAKNDEKDWANIATGQEYEQLVAKYTISENSGVTNPYTSETPVYTWACSTSGTWSEATGSETSGILAKAYKKRVRMVGNGAREDIYHLVIEPVGETGTMGPLWVSPAPRELSSPVAWEADIPNQIKQVFICDGITNISSLAFSNCSNLTSVKMSDDVTSLGVSAFTGSPRLTTVIYSGTIAKWETVTKGDSWQGSVTTVKCLDGDVNIAQNEEVHRD